MKIQSSMLLLLLVVVALADLCSVVGADFSPVALGIRSALAGRSLQNRRSSWGGISHQSRTKQQKTRTVSTAEDDDGSNLIESAFFRPTSANDVAQMGSAQSAYLLEKKTSRSSQQKETELDFLEGRSSLSPMRDVAQVSTVRSTAATATAATLSTTSLSQQARGGAEVAVARSLVFWESMVCGAISRSIAQTTMHPANTMKTLLQSARGPDAPGILELMLPRNFHRLTIGAGANFLLSVPHGAVNFAVLELVRERLGAIVQTIPLLAANEEKFSFGLDFLSSSISTITCSVVSTPQMMITDNIMAGNYPNLGAAITGLAQTKGIMGFYGGWWPGLVGKIPSYALTWTFFQQLKLTRDRLSHRDATDLENSVMGCVASAATVCLMIPMDTIKTRLVTQAGRAATDQAYKGIVDCAVRVFREEGLATFYRGLPPRLVSVVPMIGIQFGVYEFMKKVMLQRRVAENKGARMKELGPEYVSASVLEEAMMEVAASPEHPYPAPFSKRKLFKNGTKKSGRKTKHR